ncbi:acetyl-CoA hydrolase/transferase family protein [Thermodesulfobacteriota bacterium]
MGWKEYFQKMTVSAEEAANLVKSGDSVVFTMGREAHAVGLALAARKEELKDVKIFVPTPGYDFGWYDEGWSDSFNVSIVMPTGTCQESFDHKRLDMAIGSSITRNRNVILFPADIAITELSSPDENGFCSFGQSLWNKKEQINMSKVIIAEINKNLIRTYGDNFIHVSEIDYFVEHLSSGSQPGMGSLAGRTLKKPAPYLKKIAAHAAPLIQNGDTIQIGVGRTTEPLVKYGLLDNKMDLGMHTEATPPGVITLVKDGVINGKKKTIHRGKVVATSLGGGSKEEMAWVSNNPIFELKSIDYLEDLKIISSHDNMVAINNALCVDLSGQITAETIGKRVLSAAGGQFPFVVGALMSKGGRSITVLPSSAKEGTQSRIVPSLPESTAITIPRTCADHIVTEFGVAELWGKTLRQRARALIEIAHPDFREELTEKAKKMLGSL